MGKIPTSQRQKCYFLKITHHWDSFDLGLISCEIAVNKSKVIQHMAWQLMSKCQVQLIFMATMTVTFADWHLLVSGTMVCMEVYNLWTFTGWISQGKIRYILAIFMTEPWKQPRHIQVGHWLCAPKQLISRKWFILVNHGLDMNADNSVLLHSHLIVIQYFNNKYVHHDTKKFLFHQPFKR